MHRQDGDADDLAAFARIVRLIVAHYLGRPIIKVVRRVHVHLEPL